jgi:hypothetical protein
MIRVCSVIPILRGLDVIEKKNMKDFDLFGIETHPISPNPHGLRANPYGLRAQRTNPKKEVVIRLFTWKPRIEQREGNT